MRALDLLPVVDGQLTGNALKTVSERCIEVEEWDDFASELFVVRHVCRLLAESLEGPVTSPNARRLQERFSPPLRDVLLAVSAGDVEWARRGARQLASSWIQSSELRRGD